MDWIDLTLLASEENLKGYIAGLSKLDRSQLRDRFGTLLRLRSDELDEIILRILIERARPLALPATLWSRPVTSSTDILAEARDHIEHLGLEAPPDRLLAVQRLYAQFVTERDKKPLASTDLALQKYRCGHCGLAFCNEELADKGLVSPFGSRGALKRDPLKPHWSKDPYRVPTVDHIWPVSLYGDNGTRNLRVLCQACNQGKANFLAIEQTRSFTGLPVRTDLLGRLPLTLDIFYTQLRKEPRCVRTGKTATETELTVELGNKRLPAVLDVDVSASVINHLEARGAQPLS